MAMIAAGHFGKPTSRIDGRAKVTGTARYAGEHEARGLAHGFVVSSAIAKGRIKRIHVADALSVDGVLDVISHEHRPRLASADEKYKDEVAPDGSPLRPLYSDQIFFSGQPIALVVAEELEIARFAASLIRVETSRSRMSLISRRSAGAARSRSRRIPRPIHAATPRRRSSRRRFG